MVYESRIDMAGDKPRSKRWAENLDKEFLAAYDEYSDALFRHCMIRVRDRDVAKDIVQETFSRTWLYLSEGKKVEYIRAFLYRVANNLIVDGARKKKSSFWTVIRLSKTPKYLRAASPSLPRTVSRDT